MAEYEVLVRHTVDLQLAVQDNLTPLGAELVAAQIITPDQYREIRNAYRPVNERGADLVGYVQNKVRQDPRQYHAFIDALKSDLSQYRNILTILGEIPLPLPVIPQPFSLREGPPQERIKYLETEFRGLHQKLVSEVTKKRLPVDEFFQALTMLPIAFKKEYESSIQQILPAAKENDGQSIVTSSTFLLFNPLFIFIDYDLLNHMIVKFGSAELKSKMALYIEDVKFFMKETTVGDLIDHWPGCEVPDLNYAKLKAKFKDDPMTYTLERLNKFRRRFCGQVRLSEFIFCLISLESTESFFATWIIPAAIIPELSEAIKQLDKLFFKEEHIISLFVDQKQLYPSVISKSQYEKFSKDMSSEQLAEWLTTSLGGDYQGDISKLKDERIDGHTLRGLDESALDQFGVSSGFQQTLLDIIENLGKILSSQILPLAEGASAAAMPTFSAAGKQLKFGYLDVKDLSKVQDTLWGVRAQWYNLGLVLDVSPDTLDAIELANARNPERCFTAMLTMWLREHERPTWSALAEAVRSPSVGHSHLAQEIQQQLISSADEKEKSIPKIGSTSATRLSDSDHGTIYEKLAPHAAKWRDIGEGLRFKEEEMDNIQSNPMLMMQSPPKSYLRAMLSQWLQWAPGDGRGSTGFATRESLRAALLKANLGQLAQQFQ